MHVAEERILPTAEREESHWRSHTNIDTDVARIRFIAETTRCIAARREQAGLVSILSAVDQLDGFDQKE